MISNVTFTAYPQRIVQNFVKASSNLEGTVNMKQAMEVPTSLLDKFLNTKFFEFTPSQSPFVKGLELDPTKSYIASHGLDIVG